MKKYLYLIIFIFAISCSSNKGVYWCGDHACSNNKEKEAYFKKTMIVEVRNLDKNYKERVSENEKILNQSESKKKKIVIKKKELEKEIILEEELRAKKEKEIEQQIEIQEQEIAKMEKKLNDEINLEEELTLSSEKIEQKKSSSSNKVVEIKEINSKTFDELVENILIRNSSRSFPKINNIPK